MTITYKVLGQSNPAATTATTLYTVPVGNSTVASTLNVCNQVSTPATFRVAVRVGGASLTSSQYINYDTQIPGNDSIALTIGITLGAGDIVTVYANTANISFNLFGTEIN